MSRKYEHRIEYLKENKQDKNHEHHQTKKKSNSSNRTPKEIKKAYSDFQKKLDKSKKIW